MPAAELSAQVFLQVAVVLGLCRLAGLAARRINQPEVVGQMAAGLLVGPSLLGGLAPGLHAAVFPPEAAPAFRVLSQAGLCLYMFLVGAGLESAGGRVPWRAAAVVATAGTALPFALGAALAVPLLAAGGYFTAGVGGLPAALFLGAAMAVTAFPVLARIIEERGLAGTPLGNLALAAASLGDAAAWCALALVLAVAAGTPAAALPVAAGTLALAAVLLLVVRPLLARLLGSGRERLTDGELTLLLAVLFLAAYAGEHIGVHAVFGSFLAGLAVPRGWATAAVRTALEAPVKALLLPLFFASAGMGASVDLLNDPAVLGVLAAVMAVAVAGKVAGAALGARLARLGWRDALAVGALMNARGLVELLVLNVGLERGVIEPRLYTLMLLMALATTLMAAPGYHLVQLAARRRAGRSVAPGA